MHSPYLRRDSFEFILNKLNPDYFSGKTLIIMGGGRAWAPEAPFLRDTVCFGYMDAMCARQTVLEVDPNVAPPKNREASWHVVVAFFFFPIYWRKGRLPTKD